MRINSFGEFNTFIISKGLHNSSPAIADFCACVSQYRLICNCKKNEKSHKLNNCNAQYVNIVNSILPSLKDKLFDGINDLEIEFYYNQSFKIGSLSK